MRRKVGIIKRIFSLLLVFLLSINSFAAVVSDNDGSAFITKAEFDALKNSFQSQIDNYNKSIDSKIDGAVASYLAGIRISQKLDIEPLTKDISIIDLNDTGDSMAIFNYRFSGGYAYIANNTYWGSATDNFTVVGQLATYRYPYVNKTGYSYTAIDKTYMMDYEKLDGSFFFKGITYRTTTQPGSTVTGSNSGSFTKLYKCFLMIPTEENWTLDTDTGLVETKITTKQNGAYGGYDTGLDFWSLRSNTGTYTGYSKISCTTTTPSPNLNLNAAAAILAENSTTKNYFDYKFYQVNQLNVPYCPTQTAFKYQQNPTMTITIGKGNETMQDSYGETLQHFVNTITPTARGFWFDPAQRQTIESQYSYYNYKLSGEKLYTYNGLLLVKNLPLTGELEINVKGSGMIFFKTSVFNNVATDTETNLLEVTDSSGAVSNYATLSSTYQKFKIKVNKGDNLYVKSTNAANATIDTMILAEE